jgi:hypothetical protein
VSVVWQEKTPTRIPEALWFSFRPAASAVDASSWRLHKLGSCIHPHEVGRAGLTLDSLLAAQLLLT